MSKKKTDEITVLFRGSKNSEVVFSDLAGYRDYMIWLEYDADVISYFQPRLEIVLQHRVTKQNYVKVDFWVARDNGVTEFVHIHNDEQMDPTVLPRAIAYATAVSSVFTPVRLCEIVREPRRSNLEELWRHAKLEMKNIHLAFLNKFFREEEYPTVDALRKFLESSGFKPELTYAFVFIKAVLVDLENFPLSGDTALLPNPKFKLKVSEAVNQHSFFEFWQGFDPAAKTNDF